MGPWVGTVGVWLGKNWPETHALEGFSDVWVRLLQEIFWLVQKDEEPIKKLIIDTITLYVTSVNKKPVLV